MRVVKPEKCRSENRSNLFVFSHERLLPRRVGFLRFVLQITNVADLPLLEFRHNCRIKFGEYLAVPRQWCEPTTLLPRLHQTVEHHLKKQRHIIHTAGMCPGGRGGGHSTGIWVGGFGRLTETLTLFKTQRCKFFYPV